MCRIQLLSGFEGPLADAIRPSAGVAEAFRDRLLGHGVATSIRWSRGGDIRAACGQLAVESP